MKRSIIIAVLAVLVTATMVVLMLNSESRISGKAIAIGSIQLVILVFAVLVVYKRWTAAKNKLPAEDEMSKSIRRRGAATSYYVSIYMWLAFMMFEERIDLERSTLIGAGILGMVIIYALSWVYHSYIRKSHD
jgi:ABC-type branched-subunit amino acid transport system permease subunit